jgi:hypothetical protein
VTPPSLHEVVESPGELSVDELTEAHAAQLASVITAVGIEASAMATDLDQATVEGVADGDVAAAGALDLEDAAAVLALVDGAPSPDELVGQALDELLLGMTAGVLNVDVVAAELPDDLEPREVQGMLEGRHPLTLGEYAALQQVIASRAL